MTYCLNTGCRYCATDVENGTIICTIEPQLIGVDTLKGWMVKCNSYKYRPAGQSLGPVHPAMGSDGLYPGQIKAPIDYSDTDPVESVGEELFKMEQALDVPFKDRHYNSVKPEECDT